MQFGLGDISGVLGVAVYCSHISNWTICMFEHWLIRCLDSRLVFSELHANYEWDVAPTRERPRLYGQVPPEFWARVT